MVSGSRKTAVGLRAALARALSAIQPRVSRVVPYRAKCCDAAMATVLAAWARRRCQVLLEPRGAATATCALPPPGVRQLGVRRLPDRAEAHDVAAQPEATASMAAMSEPAAPGVSGAPLCHVGRIPSDGLDGGDSPFGVAAVGRPGGIGRETVDVVQRQSGVGTASSIASTLSDSGGHHQLPAQTRHADPGHRDAGPRTCPSRAIGRTDRMRSRSSRSSGSAAGGSTGRFEQREPDVLDLLEDDPDGHAHVHIVGVAPDDVGGQPDPGVLVDGDHRHRVTGAACRGATDCWEFV